MGCDYCLYPTDVDSSHSLSLVSLEYPARIGFSVSFGISLVAQPVVGNESFSAHSSVFSPYTCTLSESVPSQLDLKVHSNAGAHWRDIQRFSRLSGIRRKYWNRASLVASSPVICRTFTEMLNLDRSSTLSLIQFEVIDSFVCLLYQHWDPAHPSSEEIEYVSKHRSFVCEQTSKTRMTHILGSRACSPILGSCRSERSGRSGRSGRSARSGRVGRLGNIEGTRFASPYAPLGPLSYARFPVRLGYDGTAGCVSRGMYTPGRVEFIYGYLCTGLTMLIWGVGREWLMACICTVRFIGLRYAATEPSLPDAYLLYTSLGTRAEPRIWGRWACSRSSSDSASGACCRWTSPLNWPSRTRRRSSASTKGIGAQRANAFVQGSFEKSTQIAIVGNLIELQISAVLHVINELGRNSLAERLERRLHFRGATATNSHLRTLYQLVFLLFRGGGKALPWETALQEVNQNISKRLQVITPTLLSS